MNNLQRYAPGLAGRLTPVFFGSAVNNFGVQLLLDAFLDIAPAPRPRAPDAPRSLVIPGSWPAARHPLHVFLRRHGRESREEAVRGRLPRLQRPHRLGEVHAEGREPLQHGVRPGAVGERQVRARSSRRRQDEARGALRQAG